MSSPLRLCLGCNQPGHWGRTGRCPNCNRARVRAVERQPARRARKAARYDHSHRRLRRVWAIVIASGERVLCARCSMPIGPLDQWDLDHIAQTSHPSHADCNRRAITRKQPA